LRISEISSSVKSEKKKSLPNQKLHAQPESGAVLRSGAPGTGQAERAACKHYAVGESI